MEYNPEVVRHGNRLRQEAEENPSTFAMYNGEADVVPDENLTGRNSVRKAGPGGKRAIELMSNPVAMQQTQQWMSMFGQSNEGVAFNQGAMQKAMMGAQQ